MASTVTQAFADFIKDPIRLDSNDNDQAKISRDNLIKQISKFPEDGSFPTLHSSIPSIDFGSFSRKTKHRPLDDIDTMIVLHGQGATYWEEGNKITLTNDLNASHFRDLCNPATNVLNSIKFVNKFKDYLGKVHHYKKADIHRDGEAVRLELDSYDWSFDIVPAFETKVNSAGKSYFVIPDGKGDWKFTDPRLDKARVQRVNSLHTISVLDMIRMAKYWNNRPTMPSMGSYLMENLVLDYFQNTPVALVHKTYPYCMSDVLDYISTHVYYGVNDPKGIQGNLNKLSWEDMHKISDRAASDSKKAKLAIAHDLNGNQRLAIETWGQIFGSKFPLFTY